MQKTNSTISLTFHDGGRYHIETSFYMITASVMKELKRKYEQDIATSIIYSQNLTLNANFLAMLSSFISEE